LGLKGVLHKESTQLTKNYVENHSLASTVLIDGAPVVGDDKKPRLFAAIRKFALERGVEFEADAIEMPSGSDGKSKGCAM